MLGDDHVSCPITPTRMAALGDTHIGTQHIGDSWNDYNMHYYP